eukprot:199899-Hanusia_phi.AAC.3
MGGRREGDADGSKVHAGCLTESAQICTECEGDDGVSEKDKTCMGLENKYGAADCVSAQNGQMRIAGLQEEGDGDDVELAWIRDVVRLTLRTGGKWNFA